jgi:hypothetical protein
MTVHTLTDVLWRKSSYSGQQECVEVAAAGGDVLVRDSRSPRGPTLAISSAAWRDFLTTVPRFFHVYNNHRVSLGSATEQLKPLIAMTTRVPNATLTYVDEQGRIRTDVVSTELALRLLDAPPLEISRVGHPQASNLRHTV